MLCALSVRVVIQTRRLGMRSSFVSAVMWRYIKAAMEWKSSLQVILSAEDCQDQRFDYLL